MRLSSHLCSDNRIQSGLSTSLRDEPATMIRDGGVRRNGYDVELDELRAISDKDTQGLYHHPSTC